MNKEERVKELFDGCSMKDGRRVYTFSLVKDGMKYYANVMLAKAIWNIYNSNNKSVYNDGSIVHHKDEDKLNDDIDNLQKMTRKEHATLHSKGDKNAMYGKNITEEHRKNLSLAKTGNKNHMYGKFGKDSPGYGLKRTQETKDKISKAVSGYNNYNYGRKWSDERKEKHSLMLKESWRKRKLQLCVVI